MALMDFFRKKSSGDVAKDRLKLLLISDRANCSPEVMELIKNDIIKVISKYMEIDWRESGYPDYPDRIRRPERPCAGLVRKYPHQGSEA